MQWILLLPLLIPCCCILFVCVCVVLFPMILLCACFLLIPLLFICCIIFISALPILLPLVLLGCILLSPLFFVGCILLSPLYMIGYIRSEKELAILSVLLVACVLKYMCSWRKNMLLPQSWDWYGSCQSLEFLYDMPHAIIIAVNLSHRIDWTTVLSAKTSLIIDLIHLCSRTESCKTDKKEYHQESKLWQCLMLLPLHEVLLAKFANGHCWTNSIQVVKLISYLSIPAQASALIFPFSMHNVCFGCIFKISLPVVSLNRCNILPLHILY